jgi:hypothetical protein
MKVIEAKGISDPGDEDVRAWLFLAAIFNLRTSLSTTKTKG